MDSGHRRRYSRQPSILSPLNGASSMVSPVKGHSASNVFQATPSSVHEFQIPKSLRRQTVDVPNPTQSGDEIYTGHPPAPRRTNASEGSSGASADIRMSGSTFVHIDSDHEDHEDTALDASLMLSALPDFVSASDGVLNALAPSDFTTQKLQRVLKNPKFMQILSRLEVTFETQKGQFGSGHFINGEATTRALSSAADANWNFGLLWHKGNLARLSLDIMTWLLGSGDPVVHLTRLDECFPLPFVDSSSRDDEPFITPSTFLAGLEIRTQLCLAMLHTEQNKGAGKSPTETLEDNFTWPSLGAADEFRGWNVDALQVDMGQLPQKFAEAVTQRMDEIRGALSADSGQVDFEKLNSRFPRLEFAAQLARWIRREVDNINTQLTKQEPLGSAILRLTEKLDRHSSFGKQDFELAASSPLNKQNEHTESTLIQEAEEERSPDLEQASLQRKDLNLTELAQRIGRKFQASISGQDLAVNQGPVDDEGHGQEQRSEQAEVRPRSLNSKLLRRHIRKRYRKSLSGQDLAGKKGPVDQGHEREEQEPEQAEVQPRILSSRKLGGQIGKMYRKSLSGRDLTSSQDQVDEEGHEQEQETEQAETQEQERDQYEATHDDAGDMNTAGSPELGDPDSSGEALTIRIPYILQFFEKSNKLEEKARGSSSVSGSGSDRRSESTQRFETQSPAARRNFIDRQHGASRVSPIAGPSGFSTGLSGRNIRKRGASEIEDDLESSAFEEDRRQVDVARNRERVSKRARTQRDNDDDYQPIINDEDYQSLNSEEETSDRRRLSITGSVSGSQREASIQDDDDDNIRPDGSRRAADLDVKISPRQQRKSFTLREEKRLTKLIGKYGTAWAAILKADEKYRSPMLQNRSQVDLKDKARNLAFKYYREKKPLPPYFERISLTKKHKESLDKLGIPYELSQRDT